MAEEKPESPSHQETSNLNEQTVPPEVEIEERGLVGKIIRQIKFHHQKIFFGLIGLLVVWALVNVATRAYWWGRIWFRSSVQPHLTPTPGLLATVTPNPTASWQTYVNSEYGYLIKHPSDWILHLDEQTPQGIVNFEKDLNSLSIYSGNAIPKVPQVEPSGTESITVGGLAVTKEVYTNLYELIVFPEEGEVNHIVLEYKDDLNNEGYAEIFDLMLSTFKFLTSDEKQISFRIDKEGDVTKVILVDKEGQERVLREYQWPDGGPARRLYSSFNNQYLAISQGIGLLGELEIVNLEDERTIANLSEYGKVIWLDGHRLVLNAPEKVGPERPYEGGEGVSLAAFDASAEKYWLLKQADEETDYPLIKAENEEIFFEKRVAGEKGDWTNPKISQWKINFKGTVEMEIK